MKKTVMLLIFQTLFILVLNAENSGNEYAKYDAYDLMPIPEKELKAASKNSLVEFGGKKIKEWTKINDWVEKTDPDAVFNNITKYGYKTRIKNSPYIFKYDIGAGAFTGTGYVICDKKFNVIDSVDVCAHVGGAFSNMLLSGKSIILIGWEISNSFAGGVTASSYQMFKYSGKKFGKVMDITVNVLDPDKYSKTGSELKIVKDESGIYPKIQIETVTDDPHKPYFMTIEEWVFDGGKYVLLPEKKTKPMDYEDVNAFMFRTQNHGAGIIAR